MVAAFSSFGLIFALMVKSRETPINYILLALFVSVAVQAPSVDAGACCKFRL